MAVITETWLRDGAVLENRREAMREELGLDMIGRNREPLTSGVSYGGVAIVWKIGRLDFKKVPLKNPSKFELVVGASSIRGHNRKLVVIACYLPPGYEKKRGEAAVDFLADTISIMKRRFQNPYIVLAGDFNQWKGEEAVADHADFKEVLVGLTRGKRSVCEAETLAPLETEEDKEGDCRRSDHRVGYVVAELERRAAFTWQNYTYHHYDAESEEEFKKWVCCTIGSRSMRRTAPRQNRRPIRTRYRKLLRGASH